MQVKLAYAKTCQDTAVKDELLLKVLSPNVLEQGGACGQDAVLQALKHPIGTKRVGEIIQPGESVAIITSDVTRPFPAWQVLPPLLSEMESAGVSMRDVVIVFALGSHRKHSEAEMRKLVGNDVYDRVHCVDHDPSDCVRLGVSSRGTPYDVFRPVAEAKRRICIGNIEYHYFAGFSGGAKAIMPGVCTRDAIQANHSMMVRDSAYAGRLEGNPVREDIDEVLTCCPVDFIVNVVLDEHKEILHAVCGHAILAHREGCAFLDRLYKIRIPQRADIVLVSPGGYPKDINLYQAQKALDNAKHAVRDGGIIVLCASCGEGLGEKVFERWLTTAPSTRFMTEEIERHFELGGHKAAAISMVMEKCRVFLVSDLPAAFVSKIFFTPYSSLEEAYCAAHKALGENASVIVMPFGGSTLPEVDVP
ncbi:MAG: nickel-dependent lactate racemase [Eubacteriales bacterium]|nr:nickel-dependent lactate racemase [Eubacteriales bacterium]